MTRFLRHAVLLAAATALMGSTAFAADLPSRPAPAPVVVPPAFSWTGFYVGLNAGIGWANGGSATITDPLLGTTVLSGSDKAGFVGGGQLGYNWQYNQWVLGLEADIQYADLKSELAWGAYSWFGYSSSNSQYLGTVRARAGYAIDRTLIYITGGLAYGGLNGNWWHGTTSNQGWALGGGIEYAFTNNWTARLEGLYVNLNTGNHVGTFTRAGVNGTYGVSGKSGDGGGLVRAAINYKFDWK